MLANDGQPGPNMKVPENEHEAMQHERGRSVGYKLNDTYWYTFEPKDLPFDIVPPLDNVSLWWFVKMNPGQFMPMHVDQDDHSSATINRYWMPLQDYEIGHLFIYKDSLLSPYKKGDLYMFDDADAFHGSSNIGFSPRLIFNCAQYKV